MDIVLLKDTLLLIEGGLGAQFEGDVLDPVSLTSPFFLLITIIDRLDIETKYRVKDLRFLQL